MITKELMKFYWRTWKYRLFKDRAEIKILMKCIKPGEHVVDIGAYKGWYTYWMSKAVGSTGRVFAFEPQRALYNYLQCIIREAKIKNVVFEPIGLSSKNAQMCLAVPEGKKGYSQMATFGTINNKECKTYNVQVETLDDYLQKMNVNNMSFIKCDAEGHELEIFLGGAKVLKKYKPILFFECEQRHIKEHKIHDVFDFLKQFGYKGEFFYQNRLHPLEEFKVEYHQADVKKDYASNFLFRC